jgi:hypothetical protein
VYAGGVRISAVLGRRRVMRHSSSGQQVEEEGVTNVFVAGVAAVSEEVAHVRARFAVDPSTPARLADAWTSPTGAMEEDESEFIDAVADCVSVGLPVDVAVASWRSGSLEQTDEEPDDAEEEWAENADTNVWSRPAPK